MFQFLTQQSGYEACRFLKFSFSSFPHPEIHILFLSLALDLTIHNKQPDGALKVVARKKIIHYRQLYIDRPEPITFMPVVVDTSDHIYDDFLRLLFLDSHREASVLPNDIPKESGHFRFLRVACLANIKGSVGLILPKVSDMRISIPLDLSSRPFIPSPYFIHSRRKWDYGIVSRLYLYHLGVRSIFAK